MDKNIVVITGSSSGIGYAITEVLARNPKNVVVMLGRNKIKLAKATEMITKSSLAQVDSMTGDVTNDIDVKNIIDEIIKRYGTINTLVMSAGVSIHGPFNDILVRDYDEVIDTNLKGRFLMSKAVWPTMLKGNNNSQIINISSASGLSNYPTGSIYSAASAGVNSLMNSIMLEGQEVGIKVSNIVLGQVDTPIWNMSDDLINSARKDMLASSSVAEYVEFIMSRPVNEHYRTVVLHPFAIQPVLRGRNRGPGGKFPDKPAELGNSENIKEPKFRI